MFWCITIYHTFLYFTISLCIIKYHAFLCITIYYASLNMMQHYISCITIYHVSLYIIHHYISCILVHHSIIMHHYVSCVLVHHYIIMHHYISFLFGASLYIMHHYISCITIYHASLIIMRFAASLYMMLTKCHVFWYDWPKVNFCIITSRVSVWCMRILPHFCPRVQKIFIFEFGR